MRGVLHRWLYSSDCAALSLTLLCVAGPSELYKKGMMPLKFGLAWVKGIEISQYRQQQ